MFLPVDIVQPGDDHSLTAGGVEKFAIFDVDADVPDLDAGFEENQITGPQLFSADLAAKSGKLGRCPGDLPAEFSPESKVDETRAVDPFFTQAVCLISDPFPFFVL